MDIVNIVMEAAMYHRIVKTRIASIFAALGRGDLDYAAASMAKRFDHNFAGNHAIGGTRHTMTAFRPWLERLIRVLRACGSISRRSP